MTLCIGALAQRYTLPQIIVSFDKKISTEEASSDVEFKCAHLPWRLFAMYSGTISSAIELLRLYDYHLRGLETFNWNRALEEIRIPPQVFKTNLADQYVQQQLGISYERFLVSGSSEIDPELRRQMLYAIAEMAIDADLLICGFDGSVPRLFKFEHNRLTECTQFACIGSGANAAEHSLFRREQNQHTPLSLSLYNVWEAKKFGELSPTVGQSTYTMVLGPEYPKHFLHIDYCTAILP